MRHAARTRTGASNAQKRLNPLNVMSTIAVFAALGGGAYAAVGSIPGADGVIHACVPSKGGLLRVIGAGKKCPKHEKVLAFNQRGPQGLPGTPGAPGAAGAKGEPGPQGPGATTFSATVPSGGSEFAALTGPKNGIALEGLCAAGKTFIKIPQNPKTPKPQNPIFALDCT